jgi:hypothetical protein
VVVRVVRLVRLVRVVVPPMSVHVWALKKRRVGTVYYSYSVTWEKFFWALEFYCWDNETWPGSKKVLSLKMLFCGKLSIYVRSFLKISCSVVQCLILVDLKIESVIADTFWGSSEKPSIFAETPSVFCWNTLSFHLITFDEKFQAVSTPKSRRFSSLTQASTNLTE